MNITETSGTAHPKFVRWAVVLGIVVILNVFFYVLTAVVFTQPVYSEYCPAAARNIVAQDEVSCVEQDGVWVSMPEVTGGIKGGYCDFYSTCQPLWEEARKDYAEKAFIALIVLGVLAIVIGVLPLGSSIVSAGLSYGGVVTLVVASMQYWGEASDYVRLAIATVALLILLFLGWRRFRD